jgi:hypothetical protein
MAEITQISGSLMTDALPGEFRGKSNIEKLWRTLGQPISDADAANVWLQSAFTISLGAGVQLDALGQLLNQPRSGGAYPIGESDAAYRGKLRAAVLRNRAMGTAPEIGKIVHALLGANCLGVQVSDVPPAAFNLAVYVSTALTAAEVDALVTFALQAKSAGVQIVGICWYVSPVFGFVPSTDPPVEGYGDGNPAHPGGAWANYIYP